MSKGRMTQVWNRIHSCAQTARERIGVRHACIACAQAMAADGAGLALVHGDCMLEPVYATDARSDVLEELQATLGEGPCVTVLRRDGPLLVSDLASAGSGTRWPLYAPAAIAEGARAMFAMPLQAGAARLGCLDMYWASVTVPDTGRMGEALLYADAALELALDSRSGASGGLAELLDAGFIGRRAEVHQAAGITSVQMGVGVAEALARLRAYAFSHNARLSDVAADVVRHLLRFRSDGTGERDG